MKTEKKRCPTCGKQLYQMFIDLDVTQCDRGHRFGNAEELAIAATRYAETVSSILDTARLRNAILEIERNKGSK